MRRDTSWQGVAKWYNQKLSASGSYYHEHTVIPGVLDMLELDKSSTLLDLACGQGILPQRIKQLDRYVGIDLASDLITSAKKAKYPFDATFQVGDVSQSLNLGSQKFSHITMILALQNIEHPAMVIRNIAEHLQKNGAVVIVMNHPMFRIPRQSSWEIDQQSKMQYRRINRYYSELKIPIDMHPGERQKKLTWSFHHPLSFYFDLFKKNNLVVTDLQEWVSDKESEGKAAKGEEGATNDPSWRRVDIDIQPTGHKTNSLLDSKRSRVIKAPPSETSGSPRNPPRKCLRTCLLWN